MRLGRLWDSGAMALSLALFALLSLHQLELPGLYYDEALDAVPAMQILLGQKVELVNQAGLWVASQAFPIMVMDYVGAVNTYLLLPFFALLGVKVTSLRLMPIAAGGLTIVLTYLLAKGLFNRWVAAITTLLLAVHPSFVFWSRQGIHVTSVMTVMSTGSLLALWVWRQRGREGYLYLAFFLLGLGLSAKLLFLWFILALPLAYLVARTPLALPLGLVRERPLGLTAPLTVGTGSWTKRRGMGAEVLGFLSKERRRLLGCSLSFIVGAWMILLYNLETLGTVKVLLQNLIFTSQGVNNLDFLRNLWTQIDAFFVLLMGGHFWFLGGLFFNRLYPPLFLGALLLVLFLTLQPQRAQAYRRRVSFLLALPTLLLLQSAFTISGLGPTHLFILFPFPQMIIALAFYLFCRYGEWGRTFRTALASLLLGALLLGDLWVDVQYHQRLSETGGWSAHSDAIYRLATYLDERGIAEPMALDWGMKTNLQILTQGRVNPVEIFQYEREPKPAFFDWLYGALTQRETLYLFHSDDTTVYPRFDAFRELAQRLGKKVVLVESVAQRDGKVIYLVYSAKG